MSSLVWKQFPVLLRRELNENRNLFIVAPVALAALSMAVMLWILVRFDSAMIAEGVNGLATLFEGLGAGEIAPFVVYASIPYMVMLLICAITYLVNALYQDRKDNSILFWQSMPVSNASTVTSKLVSIALVAPAIYALSLLAIYLFCLTCLAVLGVSYDAELVGLGTLFGAVLIGVVLFYFSCVTAAMWMLPTIGWLLLFSAFARRTPLLWAIGIFILLGLIEDVVFRTQFLANWVESRSGPGQYLISSLADIPGRWFSYEMLFGLVVGSILLYGAILMRRFID